MIRFHINDKHTIFLKNVLRLVCRTYSNFRGKRSDLLLLECIPHKQSNKQDLQSMLCYLKVYSVTLLVNPPPNWVAINHNYTLLYQITICIIHK